jgi:Protein of unknown function (DUF4235)
VTKLLFLPMRIAAGVLAGVVGKTLFRAMWGLVDDQQAPKAQQRRVRVPVLALALVIEGALFRALRGLADHASRRAFARITGSWPGEQEPQPE